MFGLESQQTSQQKKDRALLELMLRHEQLNRDTDLLLEELEVSSEQLSSYLENRDNFSDKNWAILQREKQKVEERLEKDLADLKERASPKKRLQNAYSPAQHWIFVR